MTYSITLNWLNNTQAFVLDCATLELHNDRNIEEVQIPSQSYNLWFDNQNIEATWVITGKFVGSGIAGTTAWDATNCKGVPLDFIHYLRSTLNLLNPETGDTLQPNATYGGFSLTISQVFNGGTSTLSLLSRYSKLPIILLPVTFDLTMDGGTPGIVSYVITMQESSEIINFGQQ